MKRFSLLAVSVILLGLIGCSESTDTQTQNAQPAAPATTQAPAGHPLNAQQQAAVDAAKDLPKQGTVKEMMHAAGYTYMNVDTGADNSIFPLSVATDVRQITTR